MPTFNLAKCFYVKILTIIITMSIGSLPSSHCFVCSDGTLNPNGIRFGTAELYDIGKYTRVSRVMCEDYWGHVVVDKFSEISDSVCVGQPMDGDERVILFVKMIKEKR